MAKEGVITIVPRPGPVESFIIHTPDERLPSILKSFCRKYDRRYPGGEIREWLVSEARVVDRYEEQMKQFEVDVPHSPPTNEEETALAAWADKELKQQEFALAHSNDNTTDYGNADRFVNHYGLDVKYCTPFDTWYLWDQSNGRWKKDGNGSVQELAKKTVRSIYREAERARNPERAKLLAKWAITCETTSHTNAIISLSKSDPWVVAEPDEFDKDLDLLNLQNGVYNLTTHGMMPHEKSRLITRLCPVKYDPTASCPQFQNYLKRVFRKHPEIIPYLQRAVGYSLTGYIHEHVLFLLHGSGANGKSTLLYVLSEMFGDYGATTDCTTFTTDKSDSVRNDLARLTGARLVVASENVADSNLDETLIKQLTGGDKITARFLFKEYFEYFPIFKIWWCFNHTPNIRDTTHSTWRRIHLIPFDEKIPDAEQDKTLREKLVAELPGILNWALEGLKEYQQLGTLAPPPIVVSTTQAYRNDQDELYDFLQECCEIQKPDEEFGKSFMAYGSELYGAYTQWASFNNEDRKMSNTKFGKMLREHGFKKDRLSSGVVYYGVQLTKSKFKVG